MVAIHFHSFSRAYNKWLDFTAEFVHDFSESQEFISVLKVIFGLLNKNLGHPIEDPDHPFRRYADIDKTIEENYNVLATDVMSAVQDAHLRGYVVALFHSSGANHDDMKALMDEYFIFADRSEDVEYSDGSAVEEEDANVVYDEDDDGDDEEDQPQHLPNPNQPDLNEENEQDNDDEEDDDENEEEDEYEEDMPSPNIDIPNEYDPSDPNAPY